MSPHRATSNIPLDYTGLGVYWHFQQFSSYSVTTTLNDGGELRQF